MKTSLPESEVAELKEHFELFDLQSEGFIPVRDLGDVVRGYGVNLTESSLKHAIEKYDNGKNQIMFADFVDFMARKMTDPGLNEEDILDSFSVFDKDKNGLVNAQELKHVLAKMGEFMSASEVDSILADADIDKNGNIKYKAFVKKLNELYDLFT
eukprot:scaffold7330_cov146-Cylindrotheca_fusiformis.AAC.6